ncbi:hypothetical protein HDU67_010138 [Dinochytrium kinnereticum]|nr:hypothetical protein HDU67_010138 [Dinochytrium kinnereticum]
MQTKRLRHPNRLFRPTPAQPGTSKPLPRPAAEKTIEDQDPGTTLPPSSPPPVLNESDMDINPIEDDNEMDVDEVPNLVRRGRGEGTGDGEGFVGAAGAVARDAGPSTAEKGKARADAGEVPRASGDGERSSSVAHSKYGKKGADRGGKNAEAQDNNAVGSSKKGKGKKPSNRTTSKEKPTGSSKAAMSNTTMVVHGSNKKKSLMTLADPFGEASHATRDVVLSDVDGWSRDDLDALEELVWDQKALIKDFRDPLAMSEIKGLEIVSEDHESVQKVEELFAGNKDMLDFLEWFPSDSSSPSLGALTRIQTPPPGAPAYSQALSLVLKRRKNMAEDGLKRRRQEGIARSQVVRDELSRLLCPEGGEGCARQPLRRSVSVRTQAFSTLLDDDDDAKHTAADRQRCLTAMYRRFLSHIE